MDINEKLIKVAEVFARVFVKALNAMRDFIKAKWETIKEYVMNYEPMYKKPMFIRARTTC